MSEFFLLFVNMFKGFSITISDDQSSLLKGKICANGVPAFKVPDHPFAIKNGKDPG